MPASSSTRGLEQYARKRLVSRRMQQDVDRGHKGGHTIRITQAVQMRYAIYRRGCAHPVDHVRIAYACPIEMHLWRLFTHALDDGRNHFGA